MFPSRRNTDDPIVQWQNEVYSLFDRWMPGWRAPFRGSWLSPALDLEEEKDQYCLHLDLPGANPDTIELHIDSGALIISGEVRQAHADDRETARTARIQERYEGKFYREITLPRDADLENLKARLEHGVLKVTVPKRTLPERHRIAIETGEVAS
jgi:HSP20 family protein